MSKVYKFFSKAIATAENSTMYNKHGAIATYGGKVVGYGYNTLAPCNINTGGCYLHAEISACMNVIRCKSIKGTM